MAAKSSDSVINCLRCGQPCACTEVIEHPQGKKGPQVEMYACEACGAKAGVFFEPLGGSDEEAATFVEREIARRGAFFPTDFTGGSGFRRW